MFSYKMKNYALLDEDGKIIIKGAALHSRGLEPFQRNYLHDGSVWCSPDAGKRSRRSSRGS